MSARDTELLEDEVRTLQARLAELEEDLRRTKLDAYQVAERLTAVTLEYVYQQAELRALLAKYDNVTNSPYLLAALRVFVAQADQRAAAAKPAEGGEP